MSFATHSLVAIVCFAFAPRGVCGGGTVGGEVEIEIDTAERDAELEGEAALLWSLAADPMDCEVELEQELSGRIELIVMLEGEDG